MTESPGGLRVLGRNAVIYGIGNVLARGVSFFLLPIYTRHLTPADYGLLAMLDLTVDIAAMLFSKGMASGMTRFYFKTSDEERRRTVVCSAFALETSLAVLATSVLWFGAPLIQPHVLGPLGSPAMLRLAAVNFLLGTLAVVPGLLLLVRQQAGAAVNVSMLRLAIQVAAGLTFVVGFQLGAIGLLWATFLANLVNGALLVAWLLRYTGFRVSREIIGDLWRFGVPNQMSWVGTFVLNFGDRFFLQRFHGAAVVGLYGIGYTFAFLLIQLGCSPFLNSWNPMRHQLARRPREERDVIYNDQTRWYVAVMLALATGIALFARPVIRVLTPLAYHSAANVVPLLMLAYLFEVWSQSSMFAIEVSEQTSAASRATWLAVVVALVLYVALIRPFGPVGAAMTAVVSLGVRAVGIHRAAQRLWPITYAYGPVLRMGACAVLAVLVPQIARPSSSWVDMAQSAALFVGFAGAVWLLGLTDADRGRARGTFAEGLLVVRRLRLSS